MDSREIEFINGYYDWLLSIVCPSDEDADYSSLMRTLHRKEFYWTMIGDENRGVDGSSLRDVYYELHDDFPSDILEGPCTVLEMLIALAVRIDRDVMPSMDEDDATEWFWLMLKNLGLDKFKDSKFNFEDVDYILDTLLDRTYEFDGKGGLFPLKFAKNDQREVEIWYQMQGYLLENYEI